MKKIVAGLLWLTLSACLLCTTGCAQKPLPGAGASAPPPASAAGPPQAGSVPPAADPHTPKPEPDTFDSTLSPVALYDTEQGVQLALGDGRTAFEAAWGAGVEMPEYVENIFPDGDAPAGYTFREYLRGQVVVEFLGDVAIGFTVYGEGDALTRLTYRGAAMGAVPVSFLEMLFWDAWEDDYGGVDRYDYFSYDAGALGYADFESYIYIYEGALESFGVMVSDLDTLLYGESGFSAGAKPL